MSVQVKICGIKNVQALEGALAAGADFFGLVFYPPSPRSLDPQAARGLIDQARARARSVALLVDPDAALLNTVLETVRPDLIQLHGSETPERVAEIKARSKRLVIKAVKIASAEDARIGHDYGAADFILYDAKPPKDLQAPLPGGNGYAFDWSVLAKAGTGEKFILSGGLDATNVADALRVTGAPIVDVSSGVERARGEKDAELMRRFVQAAKSVAVAA